MNGATSPDVIAAVANLTSEIRALRAELDALKTEVAELQSRQAAGDEGTEFGPETLVMLAAAVTSYLGKRVRIRSARLVKPGQEAAATWARHGRAAIQTSHRLPRGH